VGVLLGPSGKKHSTIPYNTVTAVVDVRRYLKLENEMKNPIPQAHLWVTPVSEADLTNRIKDCANKWDAMMLTMNFFHKQVADEIAKQQPRQLELFNKV